MRSDCGCPSSAWPQHRRKERSLPPSASGLASRRRGRRWTPASPMAAAHWPCPCPRRTGRPRRPWRRSTASWPRPGRSWAEVLRRRATEAAHRADETRRARDVAEAAAGAASDRLRNVTEGLAAARAAEAVAVRAADDARAAAEAAEALCAGRASRAGALEERLGAGEVVSADGVVTLGRPDPILERRAEHDRLARELDGLAAEAADAATALAAATREAAVARQGAAAASGALDHARQGRLRAEEEERVASRPAEKAGR